MKNTIKTSRTVTFNLLVAGILMLSFFIIASAGAVENSKVIHAVGYSIRYTINEGGSKATRVLPLNEDSYIYIDKNESSIVISDPEEKFHIGIIKKGSFIQDEICLQAGLNITLPAYVVANYLGYDAKKTTMQAVPFTNGYARVHTIDTGGYKVYFVFTMKSEDKSSDIRVEGEASFTSVQVAKNP